MEQLPFAVEPPMLIWLILGLMGASESPKIANMLAKTVLTTTAKCNVYDGGGAGGDDSTTMT